MKKAFVATVLLFCVLSTPGCKKSENPGGGTIVVDQQEKIRKISQAIKIGTRNIVGIGLVAVPDEAEARRIAELTAKALDENVLPVLHGDNEGLVNGLKSLLELKAFDDPGLAKIKLILEMGLPLLENYLPPGITEQALSKVPDDVRAYMTAFFEGARAGIADYLGGERSFGRSQISLNELRQKLSAK